MKKKLPVDLEADLPVVSLSTPIYDAADKNDKGPVVEDELFISGSIQEQTSIPRKEPSIPMHTERTA